MMNRRRWVRGILVLALFPIGVAGAKEAPKKKRPAPSVPQPAASARAPEAEVIWEAWYTITQTEGNVRYGYYNDRVEKHPDGIHFKNTIVKSENVGRITESVVAMSAGLDPKSTDIEPTFFWYRMERAGQEIEVNGNVKDQKFLTVTVRSEGQDSANVVKKSIPKNTIYSTQFPLWVKPRIADWKKGREVSFYSILEDPRDPTYTPVPSSARFEKEVPGDKPAQGETWKVFRVKVADSQVSDWYFGPDGIAQKIELPAQGLLIRKAENQKAAETFLEQ